MTQGRTPHQSDQAETLALKALAFVAGDDDLIAAFLSHSGASVSDLAILARDPAFLAGVMDFILSDEPRAEAFSRLEGLQPGALTAARALLPGGDETYWT